MFSRIWSTITNISERLIGPSSERLATIQRNLDEKCVKFFRAMKHLYEATHDPKETPFCLHMYKMLETSYYGHSGDNQTLRTQYCVGDATVDVPVYDLWFAITNLQLGADHTFLENVFLSDVMGTLIRNDMRKYFPVGERFRVSMSSIRNNFRWGKRSCSVFKLVFSENLSSTQRKKSWRKKYCIVADSQKNRLLAIENERLGGFGSEGVLADVEEYEGERLSNSSDKDSYENTRDHGPTAGE